MFDADHRDQYAQASDDDHCSDALPPDFLPGKWDVICQRGKECFDHIGNQRFRMLIDGHLDNYMKVKSRQQKSRIVTAIVDNIRAGAVKSGGGFVRKDLLTRRWFKVGNKLAREKVGQALRDAIKSRRSASSIAQNHIRRVDVHGSVRKKVPPAASLCDGLSREDDDDTNPSFSYSFGQRATTTPEPPQQMLLSDPKILPLDPTRDSKLAQHSTIDEAGGNDCLWSLLRAKNSNLNATLKRSSSESFPASSLQSFASSNINGNASTLYGSNTRETMGNLNQTHKHFPEGVLSCGCAQCTTAPPANIQTSGILHHMFEPTPMKCPSSNQLLSPDDSNANNDKCHPHSDSEANDRLRNPVHVYPVLLSNDNNTNRLSFPLNQEMNASSLSSSLLLKANAAILQSDLRTSTLQSLDAQKHNQQQLQGELELKGMKQATTNEHDGFRDCWYSEPVSEDVFDG